MASIESRGDREEQELDLDLFNSIIAEYSSSFKNPPKNAYQIVQFCKDRQYNHKYGALNPYFSIWQKQQKQREKQESSTITAGNDDEEDAEINWESFWNEYESKYQYPPKKAIHLWNFAKEEKFVMVKYKEARTAFDRIHREKTASSPSPIEGRTCSDNTDLINSSNSSLNKLNDEILVLKVTKYTKSEDLEFIKSKFLQLLQLFRIKILHDPVSSLQLFNFINEDTKYKVRYGDVKKCYNYAVKHKWFQPMKRMKKYNKKRRNKKEKEIETITKEGTDDGDNDNNDDTDGEGVEFVLEIDHEKIEKEKLKEEEQKKEVIVLEVMTDQQFDEVLMEYNNKYKNPPRNASQIMNFAKEIGRLFKYKACRIAFNRWKNYRGSAMPTQTKKDELMEPGKAEKSEDDDQEEEEEEEESD